MNKKKNKNFSYADGIMKHPLGVFIVGILSICMGVIFIYTETFNEPIPREEAVTYAGCFERYDTSQDNFRDIYFEDGSCYSVYAHTESGEFHEKMESLEKGTKLYISVNPNNEYVVEIKTDSEELLNFELSQQEIKAYGGGYIGIGIFACVGGSFLIVVAILLNKEKKARIDSKSQNISNNKAKRYADTSVKSRILLEANVQGYEICYRRVKSVNELVINGKVYDDKKGIIEFTHNLSALVDDHKIDAGYDEESNSYIMFDGEIIKRKKRWI
ncbi:MAG: hypothetical protein IKL40_02470 [Clostridia bacterium]|nr:hypothetical protein [Clostridia bacterium]